ncbi:MAG: chemotaxis-specific protein-glutamate methyltransferase CheB [Magnetococcales bacterium]|nr:chemotaxis-specific protein-glutamate methyltransferase CheB [Magnetococcales bacterium]
MIRVFIVDDSPIARVVLSKMVNASPDMEVVGCAVDGEEALTMIPRLRPQVVLTDLHMPKRDGLSLTREVMMRHPLPILVVSVSVHQDDNDQNIFELLEAGAIDVFPKPRGGLESAGEALTQELATKIRILSGVVPIRRHRAAGLKQDGRSTPGGFQTAVAPSLPAVPPSVPTLVAIGASTGGPQALLTIFAALPAKFPLPILCIQHISLGFLDEMVSWLNLHTPLMLRVAQSGETPKPGHVYFPPEDKHLTLNERGCFVMEAGTERDTHRPAVDVTFQSVAQVCRAGGVGVLLTGMGRDGADGMLAIARAQGVTIAQDEESCVVFGMPKQAIDLGAVSKVLPVTAIARELCRLAGVGLPAWVERE